MTDTTTQAPPEEAPAGVPLAEFDALAAHAPAAVPAFRKGIDDSSWDHPRGAAIEYAQVVAAGYVWVAIKVTEGGRVNGQAYYVNPYAPGDFAGFRAAGIEHPAVYHFCRPGAFTGPDEAAVFAAAIAQMGATESERWLDVEDGLSQLGAEGLATWLRECIVGVPLTGVYLERSYYDALAPFGFPWGLKVWLADPGWTEGQAVPDGAVIIQSGQATVPGISGACDIDVLLAAEAPPAPDPAIPPTGPVVIPTGPAEPAPVGTVVDTGSLGTVSAGHSGTPVRKAQALLVAAGNATLTIDGDYGPITAAAISSFQSTHGLTVDGVVGPLTWVKLITA